VTASPDTPQGSVPSLNSSFRPGDSNSPVTTLPAANQAENVRHSGFDLWLHRLTVLMLVFVCAVVGVLLIILPWRPEWLDNHLLIAYPGLRTFVANGFVRGLCSGLGILDLWVGFWEAVHYSEEKPK
jgi:hypothetical protein